MVVYKNPVISEGQQMVILALNSPSKHGLTSRIC